MRHIVQIAISVSENPPLMVELFSENGHDEDFTHNCPKQVCSRTLHISLQSGSRQMFAVERLHIYGYRLFKYTNGYLVCFVSTLLVIQILSFPSPPCLCSFFILELSLRGSAQGRQMSWLSKNRYCSPTFFFMKKFIKDKHRLIPFMERHGFSKFLWGKGCL